MNDDEKKLKNSMQQSAESLVKFMYAWLNTNEENKQILIEKYPFDEDFKEIIQKFILWKCDVFEKLDSK